MYEGGRDESHQISMKNHDLSNDALCKTNKKILFIFREWGREEEKHRCKIEISVGCLSYTPLPGTKPTTQACFLTLGIQPATF